MRSVYSVEVEYDILISKIHRWGEIIRFGGNLLITDVEEDVNNILGLIIKDREATIKKVFSKNKRSDVKKYEIESVNICILSLVIGIDLGLNKDDLNLLGKSALLKDLGMNRIPVEILTKEESLTDEEFALVKKHPEHTVELITELGFKDVVKDIIIDHHERWDGLGYPKGKSQEEINYMARIISVVDGFNAMKEDRPYRKSLEGYDAIKSIIGDSGKRYDPSVLKTVIRSLGIYPVGTYVALNDSSICRVKSINSKTPLKPVVEVVINKDGTRSSNNLVIDIADNPKYFVVRSVRVE